MRNSILVVFLMLFSLSVSAQEGKKNQKAVIQTVLFCNHCKLCETCGKNFQANILKIKGVKMYELDEEKMTLTVYYNSQKTSLDAIRTAISKMGYDADDVKADAVAYGQLDRCCKKV
jgi:mercuric ion binding protein